MLQRRPALATCEVCQSRDPASRAHAEQSSTTVTPKPRMRSRLRRQLLDAVFLLYARHVAEHQVARDRPSM